MIELVSFFSFPLIYVVLGIVLFKYPPQNINSIYGYRTRRASKNIDSWIFAQKLCGKTFMFFGVISIIINIIVLIMIKLNVLEISFVDLSTYIMLLEMIIPFLFIYFFIEYKLKKTFE